MPLNHTTDYRQPKIFTNEKWGYLTNGRCERKDSGCAELFAKVGYSVSNSLVGRIVISWVRLTTLSKFIWFTLSESVEDSRSTPRSNSPPALKRSVTNVLYPCAQGRTASTSHAASDLKESEWTSGIIMHWLAGRHIRMSYKDIFLHISSTEPTPVPVNEQSRLVESNCLRVILFN